MCAVLGKVQPWVWETWSSQEDSLEECPEPQQVWLGLAWTSSQGPLGEVSCRPFGVESLSEQELSLQSQGTAQQAAPQGPEEMEAVAPGPPSQGRSHLCSLGWFSLCQDGNAHW